MKAIIYQGLILMLQFMCGAVVAELDWGFATEVALIILPFSILVGIFFALYDCEIKKQ